MKKLIALIAAAAMLFVGISPIAIAQEPFSEDDLYSDNSYLVSDVQLRESKVTNLYPELTDPKPYDYNRVLYFEDFEGDTQVDSTFLERVSSNDVTTTINHEDDTTVSGKIQGDYLNITQNNAIVDNYFRVKYGSSTAPVQSQCSIAELSKMQISIDICPMSVKTINVRFYDRYSNPSATKGENLISLSSGGYLTFSNSSVQIPYALGEWMSFDVFVDFSVQKYTVYLNDNAVVKDVKMQTLTTCIESVGLQLPKSSAPETYSVYIDNIRLAIPQKLTISETVPANGGTDVNAADTVKVKFINALSDFDSSLVSVTGGTELPQYEASENNGIISITFKEGLEFETEYTLILNKNITDIFGQTLGENNEIIQFTTEKAKFTSSVPEFTDKVRSLVINPYEEDKSVILIVAVINADGSMKALYSDAKSVEANSFSSLEVDFNKSSLTDGETAEAFVTDSFEIINLIRDVYADFQGVYTSSDDKAVTVTLEKAELIGNTIEMGGKLSSAIERNIVIKLMGENNTPAFVRPIQTNENGEFLYSLPVENLDIGKYTASVTGYNMAESNKITIIYLSDEEKEIIKTALNSAGSPAEVEAILEEHRNSLSLDDSLYTENTYNTLYEQIPFASYDKAIEMVYNANNLLSELNASDWSGYTELFAENSDIMLNSAAQLTKYNSFSNNQKNAVNKIIVSSSPFDSFKRLCTVFDAAVKEYVNSSSSSGGGGSGSGSGKTSSPGTSSSYKVSSEVLPDKNDESNLFVDLYLAPWAEKSVKELYKKGIISAAVNYRPLDNVTREEFVKMLVVFSGLTIGENSPEFTDVAGNEWYAPYLGAAQKAGIIKGRNDGSFGVGSLITRQDMVVMTLRCTVVMNKELKSVNQAEQFLDSAEIAEYAVSAVSEMQRAGVVSGMGNGYFEPLGFANRAQAATIISKLLEALI